MKKVLASNQTMIWTYYRILCNLAYDYDEHDSDDTKKEKVLLAITMTVTVIETFMNIYFFLMASEDKYSKYSEQITSEITNTSFSLDKKIKTWPKLLLNKEIDLGKGVGQRFQKLKTLRNKLLHFQSDHNEINVGHVKISKMLDISVYESLVDYDIESCPDLVLDFASEIFRLVGIPEDKIGGFIHVWFGDLSRRDFHH
jgi:hypothetical protein